MKLYTANDVATFQAYFSCLRTRIPLVSQSQRVMDVQLLCILYLHPILENKVNYYVIHVVISYIEMIFVS
jgi:hypothetical protein